MEQTEIAREQGAPAASILAEQAWEGKVRKVFSWIVSVYLCVVFGAFPLYFHNYYYDILEKNIFIEYSKEYGFTECDGCYCKDLLERQAVCSEE